MPAVARAIDAEGSALSLLSAASFTITRPTKGPARLRWSQPDQAAQLFRCSADAIPLAEARLFEFISLEAQRARAKAVSSLTWDGAQYRIAYALELADGGSVWAEERGQRITGRGEAPELISAVLHDIDAARADQESAVYLAAYDPLTGLWNKARMAEETGQLIGLAARNFLNPALLGLRLTNLSDINTNFGYGAGDRLLAGVAGRLKSRIDAPDTLARLSGDTFILGICDADRDALKRIAEDIALALTAEPYPTPDGDVRAELGALAAVRMSFEDGPKSAEDAFTRLGMALSHSTDAGQGFTYYHPDMAVGERQVSRAEITEDDIHAALNQDRISLAYQPIVDASSHTIHHYESLLRLKRETGEIVSAWKFIVAAEELGLVHLLDQRALELARETLLSYPEISLALNVSAATVKDDAHATDYLEALTALGAMCERVTIELTETVALEDPSKAASFAARVRGLGCEFSIDDFGSGYTSFRNLMAIEADSIKIDGSFIQDLSVTPYKQTFIRMMVDLAQTFGVSTVAEMVTAKEDAALLKRLGIDYLQGYMFGVPSPMPTIQRQAG